MEVIIMWIVFILFCALISFIDGLNLGRHQCEKCKEVKKGVKKRDAYIKYLNGNMHRFSKGYYCNDCTKGHNFMIYEETWDETDEPWYESEKPDYDPNDIWDMYEKTWDESEEEFDDYENDIDEDDY